MEGKSLFRGIGLLLACGAIAAGEFAASRVPGACASWPVCVAAAVLVALFGYGLAVRGWHFAALFLVGAALYFHSSVADEEMFRMRPWMRESVARRRAGNVSSASAARVRRDFSVRVGIGLEDAREAAALNRAILLGERAGIPAEARKAFVESGAIHVFAISGLHVMAIARTIVFFLRLLFVPLWLAGTAAVPFLWLYIWAIGAPPSAIRAGLMATLCCTAALFGRRPDGVTAWSATFLLVYLSDPSKITNVGCGLSFLVMLSILLVTRDGEAAGLKGALKVALAAWAVGTPVTAYAFGRLTPGGILASLALIPAATVSVSVGVLGLLSSYVSEHLAAHLNRLSALSTEAMAALAGVLARLPIASFETGRWTLPACLLWYAAMAAVLAAVELYRRKNSRPVP